VRRYTGLKGRRLHSSAPFAEGALRPHGSELKPVMRVFAPRPPPEALRPLVASASSIVRVLTLVLNWSGAREWPSPFSRQWKFLEVVLAIHETSWTHSFRCSFISRMGQSQAKAHYRPGGAINTPKEKAGSGGRIDPCGHCNTVAFSWWVVGCFPARLGKSMNWRKRALRAKFHFCPTCATSDFPSRRFHRAD